MLKKFEKLLQWLRKQYPDASVVQVDLRPELACAIDGCAGVRSGGGRGVDRLCRLHRQATPRPKGLALATRQVSEQEREDLSIAALADVVAFAKQAPRN